MTDRPAVGMDEYQESASRTLAHDREGPTLTLAIMGLGVAGEAGEVADLIKKHVGHGHELDEQQLIKELGDVLWYVAAIASLVDVKLSRVAAGNIAKLKARYPDGFSHEASRERRG